MKFVFWLEVFLVCLCSVPSLSLVINVIQVPNAKNITIAYTVLSNENLIRWTHLPGSTGTSLMSYKNGACTVSPSDSFLSESKYSYTCNSTVYQVTMIAGNAGSWNNHILACKDAFQTDDSGFAWIIKTEQDADECSYCESTITFDEIVINEKDNATLVCKVSSNEPFVNWNRNFGSNTAGTGFKDGQCITSPHGTTFLDNTSEYNYTCNNTVYQVTKLQVQRNQHNDMYTCTPPSQLEGTGSNWIIKVNAPVTSVTLTSSNYSVDIKENTVNEFTCTTSTARPAASVFWYIHPNGNSNSKTQITENITTSTDYNDLSVTTSVLRFVPTRRHNNTNIFCEANNSVNTNQVSPNRKTLLNVLYRADDLYVHQGNEYHVIENTRGTLSCSVKGGNPNPTLTWSCNEFTPTNQSTTNSNGNTTTTLTWTALRKHNGSCTCTSEQRGFQNEATDISLVVLYASSITSFTIVGFDGHTKTVNENDPVRFVCQADSNPTGIMTLSRRSENLNSLTSNILEYNLVNASCLEAGIYYCSSRNRYNGDNDVNATVQLFVNCHPRIPNVVDRNITSEINETITIALNVIAYPPPNFTWYQLVDENWTLLNDGDNYGINSSSIQSKLTIHSVGRDDFTSYRVNVTNDLGTIEQFYSLTPYDKPDPPSQFRHIEDYATTSSIHLEWKPGFDNGPSQTFYVLYRKSSDSKWNYLIVADNGEQTMELTLTELTEDTQYNIFIFASNEIGNSSESQVIVARTQAIDKPPLPGALIGGIAGGVAGCIILVIVIIVIIRRYPVFKRKGANEAGIRRSVSDDSDEDDGLVDNPMYVSSNNVASASAVPSSSGVFTTPPKPKQSSNEDLYTVVNKTKRQDKVQKGKTSTGKNASKGVDVYENVELANKPAKNDGSKQSPPKQESNRVPKLKVVNKDGLIYADLVFNDKPPGEKMVINGDDPTPYAFVDFTKKAEPLPESDNEDEK